RFSFPDERTKLSYELAEAVERLLAELSADEIKTDFLCPILFDLESRAKGGVALFYADDFMHTNNDESIFFIRSKTRKILDELQITYKVVDPKTGEEVV
ncbi:MAG: hypothetical protein G01um101493_79, partial [Microgenomates group bacterium Gr01-1014_93]